MGRKRHSIFDDIFKVAGRTASPSGRGSASTGRRPAIIRPQQSAIYTLEHDLSNPNWLYSKDNIGDVGESGSAAIKRKSHLPLSEISIPDNYEQFLSVVNRGWMHELYDKMMADGVLQPNSDVSLIMSVAAESDELVFGGAFLGEHASKIGAIVNPPAKVNHTGEWLSGQSMDLFRAYTAGVDLEKYKGALGTYPVIRELLTSDLSFYREYLDGVTHFPLNTTLLQRLGKYSDEQLTFRKICEVLSRVYFMAICRPNRFKLTASVSVDDTLIILSEIKDDVIVFKKSAKSRTINSLDNSFSVGIMNPASVSRHVFGRYMHSFQRSNTSKLLGQLGLRGLLDQSDIDVSGHDYSESFTGHYMKLMSQPLNNLTTVKTTEAGKDTVFNTTNDYKKMAVFPLNIIIIDNVVYSLSDSIPMNVFTEGEQTDIDIQSAEQVNFFIEELFRTDNYGYGELERNAGLGDEFMGLQTSSFNRAMADDAYNEIVVNEERVTSFCLRILEAYSQSGEKQEYIESEDCVRDLTGVKSLMDKYIHSSLNFPEHIPDNRFMRNIGVDVLVGARANGYLQASALNKGMSRQTVLCFDNVQLQPGAALHDLVYGTETGHAEIFTKALEISKELISDVLNRTCNRYGVKSALDKVDEHIKSLSEIVNNDIGTAEKYVKNEFLGDICDVAAISHLLFLSDVARDMLTYHLSRLVNAKTPKPLGVITAMPAEGEFLDTKLYYYSLNGRRFIDVTPVEKDGSVNFSSSRTNLLTTGMFGDVLAKSACFGYKLRKTELDKLDRMSCIDHIRAGADASTGAPGLYSKSYYHPDVVAEVWERRSESSNGWTQSKHRTVLQSIDEHISNNTFSGSRSVPQINCISYSHLLLDERSSSGARSDLTTFKAGVVRDEMYSAKYLRKSDEAVRARYKAFATGFKDRYIDMGEDVPDYSAISYIDADRLEDIAKRFNIFEVVLVSALIQLSEEISKLTAVTDAKERSAILDNIFTGGFVNKVQVDTTGFGDVGEDRLTNKVQGKQKYTPTMAEFVFHVLSCDSYFK